MAKAGQSLCLDHRSHHGRNPRDHHLFRAQTHLSGPDDARTERPFVHLAGSKDQIGQRLAARTDHFMPTTLLDSQLTTLEPPGPDENTLTINVGRKPAAVAAEIIHRLDSQPGSSTLGSAHRVFIGPSAQLSDLWPPVQDQPGTGDASDRP